MKFTKEHEAFADVVIAAISKAVREDNAKSVKFVKKDDDCLLYLNSDLRELMEGRVVDILSEQDIKCFVIDSKHNVNDEVSVDNIDIQEGDVVFGFYNYLEDSIGVVLEDLLIHDIDCIGGDEEDTDTIDDLIKQRKEKEKNQNWTYAIIVVRK